MTLLPRAGIGDVMEVDGHVLLEPGSPVVWFTFPGQWHDIGRFHTAAGRFTGLYANILTPVQMGGDEWRTTDLFLDLVLRPGAAPVLLDADELDEARREGWLDARLARAAEAEAHRLMAAARSGGWPPAVVEEWTLERARAAAGA